MKTEKIQITFYSQLGSYEIVRAISFYDRRISLYAGQISFNAGSHTKAVGSGPLNIPVQGRQGTEFLTFRVSISTPRSQVREMGYAFGKVARGRTPADRADVFNQLVIRMQKQPTTIVFVLRLISQPDPDMSLPGFGFAIENEAGGKLWSTSQPDFSCGEQDLICRAALQLSGEPVAFPLFTQPDTVPFVTNAMRTLTLVVIVDDKEERIDFDLTSLN